MYEKIKLEAQKNSATLVVVSKTRSVEEIMKIYDRGHRDFGENRVQELMDKKNELPQDIKWHLIGHLQTNKVKYIAPFIELIHSIDRKKLWKELHKEALKADRTIDGLLQIKIAEEDSKYGFSQEDVIRLLDQSAVSTYDKVNIRGLMGMATFTDDTSQIQREFDELAKLFNQLKSAYFSEKDDFDTLSMGMSGDYNIALERGSTMLRVGSAIFEEG